MEKTYTRCRQNVIHGNSNKPGLVIGYNKYGYYIAVISKDDTFGTGRLFMVVSDKPVAIKLNLSKREYQLLMLSDFNGKKIEPINCIYFDNKSDVYKAYDWVLKNSVMNKIKGGSNNDRI
jgi:hypothetical protein